MFTVLSPLNTLWVISETIFPANLLTGTKHLAAYSTNHLTDISNNNRNYNGYENLKNMQENCQHMQKLNIIKQSMA